MSLTVETGVGVPGADSYISLADAEIYVLAHGSPSSWAGTDAQKESALQLATQYIDLKYGLAFKGSKAARDNSLAWPRYYVIDENDHSWDSNVIPGNIKDAQVEVAIRVRAGDDPLGMLDGAGAIKRERVKVGPIDTSTTYTTGKSRVKSYPRVSMLLKPFVDSYNVLKRS